MIELPKGMSIPLRREEEIKKHSGGGLIATVMEMPNGSVKGTLVLTTHRVVFGRTSGLISKKTEVLFSTDHSMIQSVRTQGLINKDLIIDYIPGAGATKSVVFKSVKSPVQWQQEIQTHIMGITQ